MSTGTSAIEAPVPGPVGRSGPGSAWLCQGVEAAAIALLALEVVAVAAGVISRYVLNRPIAGSDEIAGLILVWLTFVGGAVALERGSHASVNSLVARLPRAAAHYVEAATQLGVIAFLAVVAYQGLRMVQFRYGEPSAGAGFDMALYPLGLLAGVTMTLMHALAALRRVRLRTALALLGGTAVLAVLVLSGAIGPTLAGMRPSVLLIGGFTVLLVANVPIAFALGIPALAYLAVLGGPHLLMVPQRLIAGADSFVLLAIPLFILAGALMETGGISRRLVSLATALVGHLRGGLAQVTVIGEVLFSGISGSTTADVAAMGALLIPSMERAGYSREEAVSIVSAASAMGILVPPCLLMVILGAIADISVTALFVAGFLPAAVIATSLMALIYVKARTQGWPTAGRASLRALAKALVDALIPLLMPVIIFGSIFSGAATVTETAVIAVLYALVVGLFVYREISLRDLPRLFLDSSVLSSVSMWLIAAAALFTWLLARDQVPQAVSELILSLSDSRWFFVLASVIIFVLFSALLEGFPAVIILGPIFYPIAAQMGLDPLHFSIIIVACVGVGLFLPPVGIGLFVASGIAGTTMSRVAGKFLPYLLVLLASLLVVAFVPWFTVVLPRLVLGYE